MPKSRPPREVWDQLRFIVWNRDKRRCVRCKVKVAFGGFHLDHIVSGKRGTNKFNNLRVLCPRCHCLRADLRHAGMVANAVRDGVIPPNWRELTWE